MCGYWLPKTKPQDGRESPFAAAFAYAGPWQFVGYEGGALAQFKTEDGKARPLEQYDFDNMRDAVGMDGVKYVPLKELPAQADLAKPIRGHYDCDVELARVHLTICPGFAGPRVIDFSQRQCSEYADEYGALAEELYERWLDEDKTGESITIVDPMVLRVIHLAIAQRYRVTPDLLTDLRWITDVDVEPILEVVFGLRPKAAGVGGAS